MKTRILFYVLWFPGTVAVTVIAAVMFAAIGFWGMFVESWDTAGQCSESFWNWRERRRRKAYDRLAVEFRKDGSPCP